MSNVLVLVRHGESEWNKLNLFTGWKDVDLTPVGIDEARRAGDLLELNGYRFDLAFTSALKRAQNTLALILEELDQSDIPVTASPELNERDYGELVGLNKADAVQQFGEEQVHLWRRSYDVPPPGGESLKDTANRVLPYFSAMILPELRAGKNVLVAAHGNSLRALMMQLDELTPDEVVALNLATGVPQIYRMNPDGSVAAKQDLAA